MKLKSTIIGSLFFILMLLSSLEGVFGQIVFSNTRFDFGILSNWSQTPAIFEFQNTGSSEEAFLNIIANDQVHVKYPRNYIQPGDKGKVLIYFEPPDIGNFNEKILLYVASATKPIEFTITGTVTSFVECPTVNQPADETLLVNEHSGLVIDKETRLPIYKAEVSLISPEGFKHNLKTAKDGSFKKSLKLGMYQVNISAEGYKGFDEMVYLNKMTPKLIFELEPITTYEFDSSVTYKEPEPEIQEKPKPVPQIKPEPIIKPKITPFTLEGIVIDEFTLKPVNKASVTLLNLESRIPYTYKTFADGKFTKQLTPGNYSVRVSAMGYKLKTDTMLINDMTGILTLKIIPVLPDSMVTIQDKPILKEDKPKTPVKPEITLEKDSLDIIPGIVTAEPVKEATPVEFLPRETYAANNIVFLIDVSSSMSKQKKIQSLQMAMNRLAEVLREIDKISLITFSSTQKVQFLSVSADNKDSIIKTIDSLKTSGMTYGIQGLEKAYQVARDNFIEGGNNQLIIATDGEFNSPDYSELDLVAIIAKNAQQGIILSTIGFGENEKAIKRMKRMAALGKGNFLLIGNEEDARTILIEEIKANSIR